MPAFILINSGLFLINLPYQLRCQHVSVVFTKCSTLKIYWLFYCSWLELLLIAKMLKKKKKKERKVCYSWDDSQLKPSLPGAISVSSSIGLHHLIGVLCCDRGPREELMNLWIIKMTKKGLTVWNLEFSLEIVSRVFGNWCQSVFHSASVCVCVCSWQLLASAPIWWWIV